MFDFLFFGFAAGTATEDYKTFEKGYVLIANKDAVEALGLSDDYATMFDISTLKDVVKMNEQKHFDILTGLDETMQKSFARDIAERINNKEAVDFNLVSKIKDECNIDIQKIANDLVLASKKKYNPTVLSHMV